MRYVFFGIVQQNMKSQSFHIYPYKIPKSILLMKVYVILFIFGDCKRHFDGLELFFDLFFES